LFIPLLSKRDVRLPAQDDCPVIFLSLKTDFMPLDISMWKIYGIHFAKELETRKKLYYISVKK
jgi:hypothetical protein